MEISVEQADPALNDTRPHYCAVSGRFVGLRFSGRTCIGDVYCRGAASTSRCASRIAIMRVARDPRCAHGYPDVTCMALAARDDEARFELSFGAIREFRAAELAQRYACAPCRRQLAYQRAPLLQHQLGEIARALGEDLRAAEAVVRGLRDDLRWLNEAFREQIGSCDELEVLGLIEGAFSLEREIQGRFSKHRLRGEWFRRDREILDYFVENGVRE